MKQSVILTDGTTSVRPAFFSENTAQNTAAAQDTCNDEYHLKTVLILYDN